MPPAQPPTPRPASPAASSQASPAHAAPTQTAAAADPTDYLHPQTLARLGSLELRAKLIVEGVMSGMHRSPHHGFSVEFAQHRPYVAGDDLRHLDWKVFGRSDKLYLKQYEQETSLDLVLLVDCSGSMDFGTRRYASASASGAASAASGRTNWTKFDHATATAAAMAFMAIQQGDRVGLGMFADALIDAADRSSASGQWRTIVRILSGQPVDRPTDFGRVIDQALAKLNNRCLLAIISDFFIDPAVFRAAMARIKHRRHDAILFQVTDEAEESFTLADAAPFEGMEGEGRVRIDPRAVRAGYVEAFQNHRTQLRKTARSFGFDWRPVSTHTWLGPPLAAFMARRNAVLKTRKGGR
jgi:uncharacterized protein (DUF58 family)